MQADIFRHDFMLYYNFLRSAAQIFSLHTILKSPNKKPKGNRIHIRIQKFRIHADPYPQHCNIPLSVVTIFSIVR